eukprot:CAMPEP_0194767798 /NCGR_PEP_ID=MMETSP0323_2-20130528/37187_1 /TAXON_ID=2866 ORGANISM="Crypthecodinium cohnii, Strain Seligo" /NCGR_SAMPLE_ID=MMETSP0323_2 /ASSEMBLY_ACC=CAM_ASM_000346 /LENGTH=35 /DNA_ID= /DNA_START= /DNA_END= /DNA_ORIENTATION=
MSRRPVAAAASAAFQELATESGELGGEPVGQVDGG